MSIKQKQNNTNQFFFILVTMSPSTAATQVIQEPFGTIQTSNGNQSVTKYTLTNVHGVRLQLITFGAAISNLFVPDKDGQLLDVVLGFDDLDGR